MSRTIDVNEILDDIIRVEDELTAVHNDEIKKSVTVYILEKYGQSAKVYLDRYFDESSDLSQDPDDDCPDCEQNAKDTIEKMNVIHSIAELLMDENKTKLTNEILTSDLKSKILDMLDYEVRDYLNKVGYFGIDDESVESISKLCLIQLI